MTNPKFNGLCNNVGPLFSSYLVTHVKKNSRCYPLMKRVKAVQSLLLNGGKSEQQIVPAPSKNQSSPASSYFMDYNGFFPNGFGGWCSSSCKWKDEWKSVNAAAATGNETEIAFTLFPTPLLFSQTDTRQKNPTLDAPPRQLARRGRKGKYFKDGRYWQCHSLMNINDEMSLSFLGNFTLQIIGPFSVK